MDKGQFTLQQETLQMIVDKLEEVRCCIIDVETKIEEISHPTERKETSDMAWVKEPCPKCGDYFVAKNKFGLRCYVCGWHEDSSTEPGEGESKPSKMVVFKGHPEHRV